jgi:hypothetical protein
MSRTYKKSEWLNDLYHDRLLDIRVLVDNETIKSHNQIIGELYNIQRPFLKALTDIGVLIRTGKYKDGRYKWNKNFVANINLAKLVAEKYYNIQKINQKRL